MARSFQFIPHTVHGVLDLLVDVSLVGGAGLAWWSGASGTAVVLPGMVGVANLLYSAFTRYALGRSHLISFRTHLVLDAVAGLLLLGGGLALPEALLYRAGMVAMGLGILGAVALTNPEVEDEPATSQ